MPGSAIIKGPVDPASMPYFSSIASAKVIGDLLIHDAIHDKWGQKVNELADMPWHGLCKSWAGIDRQLSSEDQGKAAVRLFFLLGGRSKKEIDSDYEYILRRNAKRWAMKQNFAESIFEEFRPHLPQDDSDPERESKAISGTCYAGDLRVLGQTIEGYSFTSLNVEVADGHYQIRGLRKGRKPHSIPFMRLLRRRSAAQDRGIKAKTEGSEVTWQVTAQDITAANTLNQRYRQNSGAAPDPFRVP